MAVLRSFIRTLAFLVSVVGLGILFFPTLLFDRPSLQLWRLSVFSRWSKKILRVFGVTVHDDLSFSRNRDIPRVIVANHVSYLDIPVIASLGPSLFLAKSEVSSWPLVGPVAQALGMLFVKRARLRDRALAITRIREKLSEGFSVTVFPEGTTTTTGPQMGRVPYFAGAFRAARESQVPVEVLYLDYTPLDRAAWLGDDPFAQHLWALLGGPPIQVRIRREILPALQNRQHQAQSYFWSRSWLLEGGRGLFTARSLRFMDSKLPHLLYRSKPVPDNFYDLKDIDLAYRPSDGPDQF